MKIASVKGDRIVIEEAQALSLDGRAGAVVKVLGCGLCGSDIVKFRHKTVKDGSVLGHEIVATVTEVNSSTDFQVGDKIVSAHHIPCFECVYCKSENYSMCEHFKSTNIIPGGFSEYVYLSEEHLQNVAQKIPNNLSEIEASFYEPLGCCIRAIKRADLKPDAKALVIGLGSIGVLMGQGLKAYGLDVYACDIVQERIDTANQLGLKSFHSSQIAEKISEATQQIGADAVFMTSGADVTIELALKAVRSGGKIIVFSSTPKNLGYANNEIYYRELTVMGSYSPAPVDLKDSMGLLASGRVKVNNLSTIYDIENIEKAFHDTIDNRILKAYIQISK